MARKTTVAWLRAAALAGAWIAAMGVVQGPAGSEIGGSVQRLGERLELHLRGKGEKAPAAQPASSPPAKERSREETIQPWECVAT
jgi:hypothetical protein